jgi:hypothetical protein
MKRPTIWFPALLVIAYWTSFVLLGTADVSMFTVFLGRMACLGLATLLFLIWWLSRRSLPLSERLLVPAVAALAAVLFSLLRHHTIIPLAVLFYALPGLLTAWTAFLPAARSEGMRRAGLLVLPLLLFAPLALLRNENGLQGRGNPDFRWRWSPSAEDQFLAERGAQPARPAPAAAPRAPLALAPEDWPGFRGPDRDGAVHGVKIATDWGTSPPRLIWKRRIGPGWSSIAVVGDRLFTQEQRDRDEAVVCIDAATGAEVWARQDAARFEEPLGGVGPRATPTFSGGRIYALGATGILSCLAAETGGKVWSRDIATDARSQVPMWGYAGSPLVTGGLVVVFAGGRADSGKGLLAAYSAVDGKPAWTASAGEHSYASPQSLTFDGQEQVLFPTEAGLVAYHARSGAVLWRVEGKEKQANPVLQPQKVGASSVLACLLPDEGAFLAEVTHAAGGWSAERKWTSRNMKSFFNDFVQHAGSLYGFDGAAFSCVDLATGARRWKGGRYGSGEVLLIADQPLLLVLSEEGEAVLVAASPEEHREIARFPVLTGKTWNHPVIARGRLYVRNAQEIACYELRPAGADPERRAP